MPQINKIKLHSFSSEDPNFAAKNLIQTNVTKKWKCAAAGEKSAFVVLKLDKPYHLTQIDIGNEFSAAVEVLVGNSKQDPIQFKELIFATSFMTVTESRNDQNPNRVRMFNKELFVAGVVDQKWDLIKVVCTQIFNTRRQYGLSFINLHTNEEEANDEADDSPVKPKKIVNVEPPPSSASLLSSSSSKPTKAFGKFQFRDSNSDDENDKDDSSSFSKWKNKKSSFNSPSTSSSETLKSTIKDQMKTKLESEIKRKRITSSSDEETQPPLKQDRNRAKGLMYDSDDDEPNEKLQKKLDKDKELRAKDQNSSKPPKKINSNPSSSPSSSNKFSSFINNDIPKLSSSSSTVTLSSPSKESSPRKPAKDIKYKKFDELLQGVTFVLSGYQNPERGIIRQKALDLGARYKADWDDSCTHLVCAYSNTPKCNQVKGKGKIISKKWIESCFTEQKRLPWRRFALDSNEKAEAESEDEIYCEWLKPKSSSPPSSSKDDKDKKQITDDDDDDDMLIVVKQKTPPKVVIEDSDSDDDMKIVYNNNKVDTDDDKGCKAEKEDEEEKSKDISKESIEQEYSDDSISSVDITLVECQAYKDKIFYLNGDLSATDKIKLADLIKHMLGVITKNPHKANYIITKEGKFLPKNVKAEVVKEIWVRECAELQAFIPTKRYKLL